MTIRVVIVDDQEATRLGLSLQLRRQEGLELAGAASDGAEAVRLVARLAAAGSPPEVVLMDVRMPVLDGVGATARITARWPQVRVLVLTTFDRDEYAFGALRSGAAGFLLKDSPATDLVAAIRAVAGGETVLTSRVTRRVVDRAGLSGPGGARQAEAAALVARLTARERDVLTAVGRGLTNREIAEELVLSPASVKTYVARLLVKLDRRDRVQLVKLAYDSGLPTA